MRSDPPDRTLEESFVRAQPAAGRPGLQVLFSTVPKLQGTVVPLPRAPFVLGRGGRLGEVELHDARVSSRHLEIRLLGPREAELRDLGSRNGTYLDGTSIERAIVTPSSIIRLGGTLLQLLPNLPAAAEEPADEVLRLFIGVSPAARAVRDRLRELAPLPSAVLITGSPGVGKEQAARALHAARRRGGPLVSLNCSVLTDELAASELFGHTRGAFTGANEAREGAFRRAHDGTLFLDEVGELPATIQPMLLRTLQDGCVRPLGSDREVEVRTRTVSATNRDLAAQVRAGLFRADLFSRLASSVVSIPPLRERPADVVALAQHFLGDRRLHPLTVERLLLHPWPHNVRDLHAVVALLAERPGEPLRISAAVEDKLRSDLRTIASAAGSATEETGERVDWPRAVEGRARVLEELLRELEGNVAEVARRLGKRVTSVRRWLALYGIDPERFRSGP